ncbi:hypothetical protein AMTRI_Chr02g262560 [Amborella trichopoda]
MYAMSSTRKDIAYAVGKLSRYTSYRGREHWDAISLILRYLKGTINYSIHYVGYPEVLEGYGDANWNIEVQDSLSASKWIFTLAGSAISWGSTKQTCISRSTTESKFFALDLTFEEAEWLKNVLYDLAIWSKLIPTITIYCDNHATIARECYTLVSLDALRVHTKLIRDGVISLEFVKSNKNVADPLIKALARDDIG